MKRELLYISRKHPCVWLMSLGMAASVAATLFAAQANDGKWHPVWGDRIDADVFGIAQLRNG